MGVTLSYCRALAEVVEHSLNGMGRSDEACYSKLFVHMAPRRMRKAIRHTISLQPISTVA